MNSDKRVIKQILSSAGVKINGNRPFDIQVYNENIYPNILHNGTLAAGEGYMQKAWDCKRIDQLLFKINNTNFDDLIKKKNFLPKILFSNLIKKKDPFLIGRHHYDLGNDLFEMMLDKRMVYSCGYWKGANNLDQAQENKLELICKKIMLKKRMKILDIGGGWGSFAKYAALKYDAKVVNISVSKKQIELANQLCKGLSVENKLLDYKDATGKYDRIVSVGMFEHVGSKNYRQFMQKVASLLKDDGLFLLHTIGSEKEKSTNYWIEKYIFPNSEIPLPREITTSTEGIFVIEDWHNFGAYYEKTLMAWFSNFHKNWPKLKGQYDESFYRMWKLYLLGSAGTFRARALQLWQVVLSRKGISGGYISVR